MDYSKELKNAVQDYLKGDIDSFLTIVSETCPYYYSCLSEFIQSEDLLLCCLDSIYHEISKLNKHIDSFYQFKLYSGRIIGDTIYDYLLQDSNLSFSDFTPCKKDYNLFRYLPKRAWENADIRRFLTTLKRTLSPTERLCVTLNCIFSMSVASISDVLKTEPKQVESCLIAVHNKFYNGIQIFEEDKEEPYYSFEEVYVLLFHDHLQTTGCAKQYHIPHSLSDELNQQKLKKRPGFARRLFHFIP